MSRGQPVSPTISSSISCNSWSCSSRPSREGGGSRGGSDRDQSSSPGTGCSNTWLCNINTAAGGGQSEYEDWRRIVLYINHEVTLHLSLLSPSQHHTTCHLCYFKTKGKYSISSTQSFCSIQTSIYSSKVAALFIFSRSTLFFKFYWQFPHQVLT